MTRPTDIALAATDSIRRSSGYNHLPLRERIALDNDLRRIESVLRGQQVSCQPTCYPQTGAGGYGGAPQLHDPFAVPLETPNDLRGGGFVGYPDQSGSGYAYASPPNSAPAQEGLSGGSESNGSQSPAVAGTEIIGERAQRTLDAVAFPAFVAGLIQGTFQAIVDATTQQVREYANLVASISKTVDEFTRDNVHPNQVRDALAERYPQDLKLLIPEPGQPGSPQLLPRNDNGDSPEWLARYGLEGEALTKELTEGALLEAGARSVGEERMQTLASLVLMGINRIVVQDGTIKAKLQFHAKARETVSAEIAAQSGAQQLGIQGRGSAAQTAVATMVSTADMNTQTDISIKADLQGEVSVRFRTETFNLDNFANTQAIDLIRRRAFSQNKTASAPEQLPQAGAVPVGQTTPPATNGQSTPPAPLPLPANQQPNTVSVQPPSPPTGE
ncbi:MAG: hypothetical protein JXA30_22795 [Deltaproteobacteria bacterium]|nr:hypothetical protein [Deltaproteobacteria bacterium]